MFDKKKNDEKKNDENTEESQKEKDDDFSKEADQTRFIWMMFGLAVFTLFGLFGLELFHPDEHTPVFFTSEIVHITVNGILLGFVALGSFVWGKNSGTTQALLKMAGNSNGSNGNGNGGGNYSDSQTNGIPINNQNGTEKKS